MANFPAVPPSSSHLGPVSSMSENVDLGTDAGVDKVTVVVEESPQETEAPNVVVVNAETDSGLSADASLDLGERIGRIEERLAAVEIAASSAQVTAEVAEMVAQNANETAHAAEAEAETAIEEIPDIPVEDESPAPEPEPEEIKPDREHWLWRNKKSFRKRK
jgi:hypothetical protein